MRQIVIITEDTNSGLEFYNLINDFYYKGTLTVISSGGCSNLLRTVKECINQGIINSNTGVLLACDNICSLVNSNLPEQRILENKMVLDKLFVTIRSCFMCIKSVGAACDCVDYVCWEEIPLSFDSLLLYCDNKSSKQCITKELKEYFDALKNLVRNKDKDYIQFYYNRLIKPKDGTLNRYSTIEQCIASDLVMLTNAGGAKTLAITKTEIKSCWKKDCMERREIYKRKCKNKNLQYAMQSFDSYCNGCFVHDDSLFVGKIKDKMIASQRFLYMLHNSIAKDLIVKIRRLMET